MARSSTDVGIILSRIIAIVPAILLAGCGSTYTAYSGPALQSGQIAILKLEREPGTLDTTFGLPHFTGVGVREIDGKQVSYNFGDEIQLTPGEHKISFIYSAPLSTMRTSGSLPQVVVVEAGKTYEARIVSNVTARSPSSVGGTWSVAITEER
jgi:hypothetical protein